MENQEFVIKGTIPGMIKILQKDFDMSYEEAKFFVYVMLDRSSRETANAVDKDELNAWYLTEETDRYKGQIAHTHLVINFTTLKKNLCHSAYIFAVKFFFSRGIDLVLLGADLIYLVAMSIKKIEDTDYCVYSRIIEYCIGDRDRFFDVSDITTANKENKCDYQEDNWKCTYLRDGDACTCNEKKISLAFANLAKQNIIKKVGERWMLVR